MAFKKVLVFLFLVNFVVFLPRISFAQEKEKKEAKRVISGGKQPVEMIRRFGAGIFRQASQIVFSPDNEIVYVGDESRCDIRAFSREGDLLFSFAGEKPSRYKSSGDEEMDSIMDSKLSSIMELGVDKEGNVYAADYIQNMVNVYAPAGEYIFNISLQENLQRKKKGRGASGVWVNSRGDIYISDSANGRIEVRDMNGRYKYQITKFKTREGKKLGLISPGHLRINSFDEIYVIDPLICKVHRFNAKGNYLGSFGQMGDTGGSFYRPSGLSIDKMNRIYVLDLGLGLVQVFKRDGTFLYALSNPEGRQIRIPFPIGIGVDDENLIYISNGDGPSNVKVFKYVIQTK